MRIYQLQSAKDFTDSLLKNKTFEQRTDINLEALMQMYAEDVAKRFAAECVNEALGNKLEVSNSLHIKIQAKYKSIIW